MNLVDAQALADRLMREHRLTQQGWVFKFDSAPRRYGVCRHSKKTISMSRVLTQLNEEPSVKDTILHEIAHALVGSKHDHDRVWQTKAIEIGCNGKARYNEGGVKDTVDYKPWKLTCPRCPFVCPKTRRTHQSYSCPACRPGSGSTKGLQPRPPARLGSH